MPNLTTFVLMLIPLAIAGGLIFLVLNKQIGAVMTEKERIAYQGVVKKDWVATGRIDFATQESAGGDDPDRPADFKLLVEERRIVESIAGNENLEIQWRLATLKEAKAVTAQYHQFLADHGLIRSVAEKQPAPAAAAVAPTPASARVSVPGRVAEPQSKPPTESMMRVPASAPEPESEPPTESMMRVPASALEPESKPPTEPVVRVPASASEPESEPPIESVVRVVASNNP